MSRPTIIDPLQGLRESRDLARENAERLFQAWRTTAPDDALGVLAALLENLSAYAALTLELIRQESSQ